MSGLQDIVQEKKNKLKEVKQCRQVYVDELKVANEQIAGMME